jgi:WD40 repeat protein
MSGEIVEGEVPILKPKWGHQLAAGALSLGMGTDSFSVGFEDGSAGLFSLNTGKMLKKVQAHSGSTLQARISPSGKFLGTCGEDGYLRVFDIADGDEIFSKQIAKTWAENLLWSKDRDFVVASAGKFVIGYDVVDKVMIQSEPFPSTVGAISWLNESKIGVGYYGGLSLLSRLDLKVIQTFAWKGSLISVKFSPKETFAACGSQDASIHLWDLKTGHDLQMSGFSSKPREISFHSSGDSMANASGTEIAIWDFRGNGPAGRSPQILGPTPAPITSLQFQNKGALLFSCDQKGVIFIWSPPSDVPVGIAGVKDEAISAGEWTFDDQTIVTTLKNGYVVAYDVPSRNS